jgi:hypothetical protein
MLESCGEWINKIKSLDLKRSRCEMVLSEKDQYRNAISTIMYVFKHYCINKHQSLEHKKTNKLLLEEMGHRDGPRVWDNEREEEMKTQWKQSHHWLHIHS